jgi:serine/threonine protein kinase
MHVAPEILTKTPYGTSVDCWALGVVMFTIIGGAPPFYGNTNQETFKKILAGDFQYDEEFWGEITQDCKDMINGLLTKDMKERWTTQQCLDCAWMHDAPKQLRRCSLMPNMKKLMEFNAKRKMKAAVQAVNFASTLSGFCENLASQMNDESMAECRRLNDHRSPIED